MKRAAIYCRVSTVHHGQSVDMQLHDLRKLAEQCGFQIVKEYSDQGISGSKSSRPALDAMLADAKRGKFQILLTWRLDRLGRSTAHLIHLLEDLKNSGVELISFSEGLDFSTASGKLFYTLITTTFPTGRKSNSSLFVYRNVAPAREKPVSENPCQVNRSMQHHPIS